MDESQVGRVGGDEDWEGAGEGREEPRTASSKCRPSGASQHSPRSFPGKGKGRGVSMANGEVSEDEWDSGPGPSSSVAPPRRAGGLRSEGEESDSEEDWGVEHSDGGDLSDSEAERTGRDEAEAASGDLKGGRNQVSRGSGDRVRKCDACLMNALLAQTAQQGNGDEHGYTDSDGSIGGSGGKLRTSLPCIPAQTHKQEIQRKHIYTKGKICGIYKLVFPSGKGYVGQSRDIAQRWSRYRTLKVSHKNTPVDNAILKYGWENVEKFVICECTEVELNYLEGVHMLKEGTKSPSGYNLRDAGNAGFHHPSTREKMKSTWAGKAEWTRKARKQQALDGGKKRIAMDRAKVLQNGLTAASNTEKAKAKRRATWDRKREEKLANMHPEKAAKVRKQAESDAKRLQERGPSSGYTEYQAKRREEVREERRARGWLG